MPIKIPTDDDVFEGFRTALRFEGGLSESATATLFDDSLRGLLRADWAPVGKGVEALTVSSNLRLLRIAFGFNVEKFADGQFPKLRAELNDLRQTIAAQVPANGVLSVTFGESEVKAIPTGRRALCLARCVAQWWELTPFLLQLMLS